MRGRRFAAPLGLADRAAAHEVEQPGLQRLVRLPQLAVVDLFDSLPESGLAAPLRPVAVQNGGRTPGAFAARATTARARRW